MAWKYKTNASESHAKAAAAGNLFKPVVCKKRNYGKPCEHCQKVNKLSQSEDDDDKKIAGKCRAKSTYYMNVVDLLGKKTNQILGSGVTIWKELIENLPDDDGDGVDFTDPDDARAILLKKTGKGLSTRYSIIVGTKAMKIPGKYLTGMHELHKVLENIDTEGILFEPKAGKNKFLVLPPWGKEAKGDFFNEVFYHWNTDLLGASEDDGDGFGDDGNEEFSGGDDESYSDEFENDASPDKANDDDEFGGEPDADSTSEPDDFESGDDDFDGGDAEKEVPTDFGSMDKAALVKWAGLKGIKLSDKAKKAPVEKLAAYLKKKEKEDAPW